MTAHILIIGAGVIGLQTAITFLSVGYNVTILAEYFPGDEAIGYTSPWAGAIWRTHSSSDQVEQCEWDLESYRQWMRIVDSEPERAREMGIERRPIYIYTSNPTINLASPKLWFHTHIQNFAPLPLSSLPSSPHIHSAYTYTTITINPPKYLSYLYQTITAHTNSHIIRARLPTTPSANIISTITSALALLSSPSQHPKAIINCTGLGARTLVPDPAVYPIRGQTVLARLSPIPMPSTTAPLTLGIHLQESTGPDASHQVSYVFPRPGSDLFVMGGTKVPHEWSPTPDVEVSRAIVERCSIIWPALADVDVSIVATHVGLRPGREGGVRVEEECVTIEGKGDVLVVHQYGHAGAGFQLSIGSARKVLEIVEGSR